MIFETYKDDIPHRAQEYVSKNLRGRLTAESFLHQRINKVSNRRPVIKNVHERNNPHSTSPQSFVTVSTQHISSFPIGLPFEKVENVSVDKRLPCDIMDLTGV